MNPWDPASPYNDLPLLPPKPRTESNIVLKRCVEARAALAELNQATKLIPQPGLLINTIPLLEARASSEIENIITTMDRLFQYAQVDAYKADTATKEALRYRTALNQGFERIQSVPVGTRIAVELAKAIKGTELDVRSVPGTQLVNEWKGKAVYTPPEGENRLRNLLANWESFLHNEKELDPLVRMAIGHYQFEAIHPFTDGNGRVGRILNILYLIDQGLIEKPILYLSGYIIQHKEEYYQMLRAVTRNEDWESWCLFMLQAIEESARWTTAKIKAILGLFEHTSEFIEKKLPSIHSKDLIDTIFTEPYCRIKTIVDRGIAKRQTASSYLNKLSKIGVLEEMKIGREKLFFHPKFIHLLLQDNNDFDPYF